MLKAVCACVIAGSIVAVTTGWSRGAPPAATQDPIEGAWRHVATATPGATQPRARPGFYLFADGYYSITRVDADSARPHFPADRSTASAELLTQIWGPFTAQAGEYSIEGSRLTTRPLVAKNPAVMSPGTFNRYEIRIAADTLWLRVVANQDGAIADGPTHMLLRTRRQ